MIFFFFRSRAGMSASSHNNWSFLHLYLSCVKQTLQNDMTCSREPLFQQSSQFVFSVRLHSYKIFPHFSSIVVHLVHVHWLPISVALVFLQVPLPYGLFLPGSFLLLFIQHSLRLHPKRCLLCYCTYQLCWHS